MFILKNILNKKMIFFFALFALFVFWPFQKVEAYCGDGNAEVELGEQCDNGQFLWDFGITDNVNGGCRLTYSAHCNTDCTVDPGYYCIHNQMAYDRCTGECSPGDYGLFTCTAKCGDGVKAGSEACDDGGSCFTQPTTFGNACTISAYGTTNNCTASGMCGYNCPQLVVNNDIDGADVNTWTKINTSSNLILNGNSYLMLPYNGWSDDLYYIPYDGATLTRYRLSNNSVTPLNSGPFSAFSESGMGGGASVVRTGPNNSGNDIYGFYGGTFKKYSISANTYTNLVSPPLGVPMRLMSNGGGANDKIYGLNTTFEVYSYSPASNSWAQENPTGSIPGGMQPGGELLHNGTEDAVYATQGGGKNGFSVYSISGKYWRILQPVPVVVAASSYWQYTNDSKMLRIDGDDNIYLAPGGGPASVYFYRYSISANTWTRLPDLPYGYYDTAQFVLDSNRREIYYRTYSGLYRYSLATNSWSALLASPPVGFNLDGKAIHKNGDDFIYFSGGYNSSAFYRYSISTNTWVVLNSTLVAGGLGSFLVFGTDDLIFFTQGNSQNFYKYTISTGTWTQASSAPGIVGGTLSKTHFLLHEGNENYIYSNQGFNNGYATGWYRYSISDNSWISLTSAVPSYWSGFFIRVSSNSILEAPGGSQTSSFYNYSISDNSWTALHGGAGSGLMSNTAMRENNEDNIFAFVSYSARALYKYSISGKTWTALAATPTYLTGSYGYYFITTRNHSNPDHIYAMTDFGGTGFFYRYSISANTWTRLADSPFGSRDGSSLQVFDNYVYLVKNLGDYSLPDKRFARYSIASNTWTSLASVPYTPTGSRNWQNQLGENVFIRWYGTQNYLYTLTIEDNGVYRYTIPGECPGFANGCKAVDGTSTYATTCTDPTDGSTYPCTATNPDGCRADCTIEPGWVCNPSNPAVPSSKSICISPCGNENVEAQYGEQCDDGEAGKLRPNGQPTTAPYNGTVCSAVYGSTCQYCGSSSNPATACKWITVTGPRCGDGTLQSAYEKCEGTAVPSGQNCSTIGMGFTNGTLACNPSTCGWNTAGCYRCGDGNINPGEQCDGTNIGSPAATCAGQPGLNRGTISCNSNCTFNTSQCYMCGDGLINSPLETCDQGGGNVTNNDGCSSNCQIESGWACTGTPSVCAIKCGNGVLDAGEICDQALSGALSDPFPPSSGDGCSSNCMTIENGYSCTTALGQPSVCATTCGNGIIDRGLGETCDQGINNYPPTAGDGCDAACHIEANWTCTPNAPITTGPSACISNCGDGIVNEPVGGCDYGVGSPNRTILCVTSSGYDGIKTCRDGNPPNTPAMACTYGLCSSPYRCGDGIVNGPELSNGCDNDTSAVGSAPSGLDGCSSTCQIEVGWSCTNVLIGGGPNRTSNCARTCGNGVKEPAEICDPNDNSVGGTATRTCTVTSSGYPGTEACQNNCTYGTCSTTLRCGDTILTQPPEDCEGSSTEPCSATVNGIGGYAGTRTCSACKYNRNICDTSERCGDNIVQGDEVCDFTTGPGCSDDCKMVEEGYTCFDTPPYNCVFSCGNNILEASAPYNEECDEGKLGVPGATDPFNGDDCTPTAYGQNCTWCDKSCKEQIVYGSYCGDGIKDAAEQCDDGNSDLTRVDGCSPCEDGGYKEDGNIGCANGCKIDYGFNCVPHGTATLCSTRCGDNQCAVGAESCVNCPQDCGPCPIGQRPLVALTHPKDMVKSLFDKIKLFLIQPKPLIQIPGLNLGTESIKQEFVPPPPPVSGDYEIGKATPVKIGDEYFVITVQKINPDNTISFTIK